MDFIIKRIIVPTDFSETSIDALLFAAHIADVMDSDITLLHVMETYEYNALLGETINVTDAIHNAVKERLTKLKTEHPKLLRVHVDTRIAKGKIHKEIAKAVEEENADLVVMGTHGASGPSNFEKYLLGSNAYRTVYSLPVSTITLRKDGKKDATIKNIVFPVDVTKESEQKVSRAIFLAKTFDATVHVILVSSFLEEFTTTLAELKEAMTNVADKILEAGIKVKVKMIRHNDVADSVMDYAEDVDADLIMIMTKGETRWNDMVIGSNARKIISESKVPVLSIRPEKV